MLKSLSVVVPAYNEEARIGISVEKILSFITTENLDAELIVVDDGSTDETKSVTENVAAKYPKISSRVIRYDKNRGKGFAVRTGLAESQNEIALFCDADLSAPIEEYKKLIGPIEKGEFDITFGSRAIDRSLIGKRQSRVREQGGRIFNRIIRKITGLPYRDTQCGFKAFDMEKFRPLLDRMTVDRFGFDVEFLFVAKRAGLKLKEIPVRWDNDEQTKVSIWRDGFRIFGEIRQIIENAKRGIYD